MVILDFRGNTETIRPPSFRGNLTEHHLQLTKRQRYWKIHRQNFLIYSASGCGRILRVGYAFAQRRGDPLNAADWIKSPEPVLRKIRPMVHLAPTQSFFKSVDALKIGSCIMQIRHPAGCGDSRSPRIQKFTEGDGHSNFGEPVKIMSRSRNPRANDYCINSITLKLINH